MVCMKPKYEAFALLGLYLEESSHTMIVRSMRQVDEEIDWGLEEELADDENMENALDRDDIEHTLGGIQHHVVLLHNDEHFAI
ncbi:hypothetical protein GBA52_009071 [Prunus armeniaca]|nr:hypothetical protein GBA52_009071 [Prunus armeniaca]